MGKKIHRINQIIELLKRKNGCSVKELAEHFNVTEMTIRRDLIFLKSYNVVNNVYGATIYNPLNNTAKITSDYSLLSAKTFMNVQKNKIGALAATLIEDNDSIIIDTGSTTEKLADHIVQKNNLKVLCYNINIMNLLIPKEYINLTFAGGFYHHNTQMCEGTDSINAINSIRATKVFVSAAGIHKDLGITCANHYEVSAKKAMINSSNYRILLADSSKFGQVHQSYFANFCNFQLVITDSGITSDWLSILENLNIKVMIAE